ncbi:MAG TPA: gluconate 2-dehydrogenase subunit 3 family protein, partial [Stellaceae bacterium]|nr:gluconate 2-dehydrogenase subunit 3 family protein [Stellaceae bacterium]
SDHLTLTEAEAAFLKAAADTIIPADALSPSASACGVIDFIDCELAGPYGEGARLYRDGPIAKGKPEHGYQLGLTPREFFRAGIAAADAWTTARFGCGLAALDEAQRATALSEMESGTARFADFEAREFLEALLAIVMEGFFADPYYGGNRDLAGWKMIGYPGLPADYQSAIEKFRGKRYSVKPRSIGDYA